MGVLDLQEGKGLEVWRNGGKYEGEFNRGLKHGKGRFTFPDGSLFNGQFECNDIHGAGIYTWANGRRYQGQWQRNCMHGRGTFTWPDGQCYCGEYADDVKHGVGMLQASDGRIFAGRWYNGELRAGNREVLSGAQVRLQDERSPDAPQNEPRSSGQDDGNFCNDKPMLAANDMDLLHGAPPMRSDSLQRNRSRAATVSFETAAPQMWHGRPLQTHL